MTEIECAWLAGLLEGEGCFRFQRTAYVILSMTDEDIVDRAAKLMGGHVRRIPKRSHQTKDVFSTQVLADKALSVMASVLPYMGSRRSQKIKAVIAACHARPGKPRGQRARGSKLTDEQARDIKAMAVVGSRKVGERTSDIAKMFGVSQSAIWYVLNKRYLGEDSTWIAKK